MNADFIEIARYASKAPSGHNTQPWKFRIADDQITILPDFESALPIVDEDNRELFISLGCAVENLCIAANNLGYETDIMEKGEKGITVKFVKGNVSMRDPLFQYIERRQTNRSVYNGNKITGTILKQLQSIQAESHIQLYFAEINTPLADTIAEYIIKGNEYQMSDMAFKNELLSWMRFNRKQIEASQSGLSYLVFGNPPLPQLLAKPIVNLFLKPDVQNKSDRKKIKSSSHFVVCTTRQNTIEEWIDLGRTLQRFLLKATACGIACAFVNQPCEITAFASEMREILPIHKEYPTLLLRIGYAGPLPYSPRKEVETLLV